MPAIKKASKKVATSLASKKSLKKGTTTDKEAASTSSPVVKKVLKNAGARKTAKKLSTAKTNNDATTKVRKRSAPSMSIDFAEGTDMKTAFQEVMKGGFSRGDVARRLAEIWKDTPTRTGQPKPVSTIINHVVRRAKANGYDIVQTWQLVKMDADGNPQPSVAQAGAKVSGTPKKTMRKGVKKAVAVKTSKKAVKRRS